MSPDPREAPSTSGAGERGAQAPARSGWRRALRWAENLFWVGILAFALVRLGPQIGAWLGVGPTLGTVPDFQVVTLAGVEVDAESLRGQVAVVNFWATWCPPCRVEIPALQRLHEDFADAGLVVLGLSTDAGGVAQVSAFLEERGVSYPVAIADPATRRAFGGISALPTTFILDRQGVIRHRVFGFFAPPAMRAAVERLLEAASAAGEAGQGGSAVRSGQRLSGHDSDQPIAEGGGVGGRVVDPASVDLQDDPEAGFEVEALDRAVEELPVFVARGADLQTLPLADPGAGGGFAIHLQAQPLTGSRTGRAPLEEYGEEEQRQTYRHSSASPR